MKRIFIISLLALCLTTSYAYATMSADEIAQTLEKAKHQVLTQDEVEELIFAIIALVDLEEIMAGDYSSLESIIQPNQSIACVLLYLVAQLSFAVAMVFNYFYLFPFFIASGLMELFC